MARCGPILHPHTPNFQPCSLCAERKETNEGWGMKNRGGERGREWNRKKERKGMVWGMERVMK